MNRHFRISLLSCLFLTSLVACGRDESLGQEAGASETATETEAGDGDGDTGDGDGDTGDGDGDTGDGDGDTGDGDGDTGDGDGDTGTGDGDTGDGDGDTGDGDGDTGDGDGDTGDGDGDEDTGDGDGDTGDGDGDGDGDTGDGDGDGDLGVCEPAPEDDACDTCVKSSCCSQLEACVADEDCECIIECLEEGNNQFQCNQMCGVMGINQPSIQLGNCTNTNCGLECL